jgi:hypothetical protein
MGVKRVALVVGACIAIVLSLYAIVVIFGMWTLVPKDPTLTVGQDLRWRIGFTAVCLVVLAALISFARWAFRKQTGYRNSN